VSLQGLSGNLPTNKMTNIMQQFKRITQKVLRAISFTVVLFISGYKVNGRQAALVQMDQAFYHRMKLGDYEITALSDGTITIDLHELLTNSTPGKIDQLSEASYQTAKEEASVNAYLLKVDGNNVLIGAGTAELYGPTLGHYRRACVRLVSPRKLLMLS
jgi:hypothetical protein